MRGTRAKIIRRICTNTRIKYPKIFVATTERTSDEKFINFYRFMKRAWNRGQWNQVRSGLNELSLNA